MSPYPRTLLTVSFIALLAAAYPAQGQPQVTSQILTSGLSRPVFATSPPGDYRRLFIVEQRGSASVATRADIRIWDLHGDSLFSKPFLSVSPVATGNEEGLLGLAFHPNYAVNGYFYTYHTNSAGNNVVTRYKVSAANPDSAAADSAFTILPLNHPSQSNHNGGWIGFGPDGYLYIATGDGGGGGDPFENGQSLNVLLGKMLRIDLDGGSPYAIPPSNPFFGGTERQEIFYWGLRNPWRNSFDRQTGAMFIADVGQNQWEEINWRPAADSGNINFGWDLKEGTHCYEPATNCDPLGITTDPIYEYSHDFGCSITGGYVYRGCAIPAVVGDYFFGDYCAGTVFSFAYSGVSITDFKDRTSELGLPGFGLFSFAEDNFGELYVLYQSGTIYKIMPVGGITDCNNNLILDSCEIAVGIESDNNDNGIPDSCDPALVCGDADGSLAVSISDAVYLINYIFAGGPAPDPLLSGDADCSGALSISDAVYLINYIFAGGPAPCASCP
ncbi:MAG: PQQ-dependent sugar dehydrogenase [candidate division Zixibacteria bacterium]|nr:PQQ-dependent sugar dehydrogenase [candidate division Zixibacteria bacterium]